MLPGRHVRRQQLPPPSSSAHVAQALLLDLPNPEGLTLWLHLNKEEGGLPLTKTLEAQTELELNRRKQLAEQVRTSQSVAGVHSLAALASVRT